MARTKQAEYQNTSLQDVARGIRESQETLTRLEAARVVALNEYTAAVAVAHEKDRLATIADGKVELQKATLAHYLQDAHDMSLVGLARIGR